MKCNVSKDCKHGTPLGSLFYYQINQEYKWGEAGKDFMGENNEFYFEHVEFEVPVGILGGYVLKAVLYTDLAVLDKSQADSIIWQSSSYKL